MKTRVAIAVLALAAGTTMAQSITVDISGVESRDGLGDASNVHLQANLGAGAVVTGISWDVGIETVPPSWLCEPQVEFTTNGGSGSYSLLFSATDCFDGTGFYAGGAAVNIAVGGDGILDMEFWENFVDFSDAADAYYLQGSSITIEYVPAPSALALLGLGGLAATRRRR